jgi:SAM-dependent methyltransferase
MRLPFERTIKAYLKEMRLRRLLNEENWRFSNRRARLLINEYQEWRAFYLPISVKGLTVLDVGAGEGETAKLFLDHGASQVICIEPYEKAFRYLKENAIKNNIIPLFKKFELRDFTDNQFDFLKMDIEGYEEILLEAKVELECPAVIEVHGMQLWDRFSKAGWRIKYRDNFINYGYDCVCYAYWKC